jgi:hypothetical protein
MLPAEGERSRQRRCEIRARVLRDQSYDCWGSWLEVAALQGDGGVGLDAHDRSDGGRI